MSYDPLTGLKDKHSFIEKIQDLKNNHELPIIVRTDVIHLKTINDRYGYKCGDELIRNVVERLKSFEHADLYRNNPVSFTMIVSKENEPDYEELLKVLTVPVLIKGDEVSPKIRIIHLQMTEDDDDRSINNILNYSASKREMLQDRIIDVDDDLRAEAENETYLLKELLMAINNESFEVNYQPVLDVRSGRCISAEALGRLTASDGKRLRPDLMFSYAEKKHLGKLITAVIMKKVCIFLRDHPDLDISSISINMTPEEFLDPELMDKLNAYCKEYGIKHDKIALEMTERTIQDNPNGTADVMNELKKLGISSYLDDFGTGYSNISSLIRLPFAAIKLDKSLIDTLADEDSAKMISLLVKMIHIGEARIIAEGVETKDQMKFVEDNMVDRVQGYYYSRPLNEEDFVLFVKDKNI